MVLAKRQVSMGGLGSRMGNMGRIGEQDLFD